MAETFKLKPIHFAYLFVIITVSLNIADNRINSVYNDTKIVKIHDNQLLVLKRGDEYGILRLRNQRIKPENADYEWYLSSSKKIDLNEPDSYKYGYGITGDGAIKGKAAPVQFGNYKFYWSPCTDAEGYIYLNYFPEYNEKNGPFFWAVLQDKKINSQLLDEAGLRFQKLDITRKNILDWIYEKMMSSR